MNIRILTALWVMSIFGEHALAGDLQVSTRQVTNIPAQSLGTALQAFAHQRDLQVLYRTETVGKLTTAGASGELTADQALAQLLTGTGLTFQYLDDKTVTIVDPTAAKAPTAGNGVAGAAGERKLAEASGSANSSTDTQDDKSESPRLEEVVVTAQKRKERLQDVPISITALSGRDLDKSSGGIIDALARVPGISMVGGSVVSGTNLFGVRGVIATAGEFNGAGAVAYYIDSVPYGFVREAQVPDVNSFDLEQVEVLRGPQGTLYGASALNGVVRILTHDADLNALEFKSRATLSQTQGGSENDRGDAAFNVPLVPGKLAVRAALGYDHASGWIDSPVKNEINDNRLGNARFKLNAQPTDRLSLGLTAWFSRLDSGAPPVGNQQDFFAGHNDQPGSTDFDSYGLKIGYELPGVSLSSMTSYIDYRNSTKIDYSQLPYGIDGTLDTTMSARALSEEFLARSNTSGSWRWTAGAFYRDTDERLFQTVSVFPPTDISDLSRSYAFFGELTRIFNDGKFELTGGLRYFEDEVRMHENYPITGVLTDPLVRVKNTFDKVTPRLVLSWHPSSAATYYASYSEGFRSGYQNGPYVYIVTGAGSNFPPVEPDSLKNYEVGTKGALAGGRVSYDASVYYMDWRDIQVPGFVLFNGIRYAANTNGTSASGLGVDFAAQFHPVRQLNLGVSLSWNGLEQDETVLNPSNQSVIALKGDRLSGSSEYTAGTSIEYLVPLGGSGLEGGFSASVNYSSQRPVPRTSPNQPSDNIVDGRIAFSVDAADRWTASVFVDNVTNERKVFSRDVLLTRDEYQRPRTIGAQFEYRFKR